jgi:serine phosphatase RsbU (regulator of sigma subunit)
MDRATAVPAEDYMVSAAGDSAALRRAELQSERVRILATLATLCLVVAFTFARRIAFAETGIGWTLAGTAAIFAVAVFYEAVMLRRVTQALHAGADLPARASVVNVVVEAVFPGVGILLLVETGMAAPYAALVAPVVLLFFVFISLSTLRLSPFLARLSGVCSAVVYGAVAGAVFIRHPEPDLGPAMHPVEYYAGYTAMLLAAGFVAGEVARQIRRHVEVALSETRRVEHLRGQLETARTIQEGLLPTQPPALADYDVAGWNKPADETGGDYYYWQVLPDGRIVFTLADVTGHGIGAALLAAACHAYSRAAMSREADLGSIVSRVNELLCAELPPGKMITYVAGTLEPATGRVDLLSAGHAPLLHYVAGEDRVYQYPAHGIPFGIVGTLAYGPPQELVLNPGDMIVLTTDGFFEWENARDEDYGFERLSATIRGARAQPSASIISTLYESVLQFAGGTVQKDDLTAVVVKRCR